MLNKVIQLLSFSFMLHFHAVAKKYTLSSPDKKNIIQISVDKTISWAVLRSNELLIKPSPMSLLLEDGRQLGVDPLVLSTSTKSVNQIITAIVPVKNKTIPEIYNELKVTFKGGYSVEFRSYNDGVAYRFTTNLGNDSLKIQNEEVVFNLNDDNLVYLPKEKDPEFQSHFEALFNAVKLTDISSKTYGYLPLYMSTVAGTKIVITESGLNDYPNLFLFGSGSRQLAGAFPKVALELKNTNNIHLDEIIVKKANYHAKTTGNRTYPWRVVIISPTDRALLENEMVYKLAEPNVLADTEWIKPGKVAWDWWNDNNIYGVNFKSGLNTDTYKYYIDFASEFGLDYIILDECWSRTPADVMVPNPQLNIPELIKYANGKKVGVLLWTLWKPMDENMEKILDLYVKWGVKGVKVDFMARADQYVVNFYERMAKSAANHKLLVDFHGAYKPVGLNRKYPNVLNYEGVKGLEQSKWDSIITPVHNTILPFTRMVAGPMDYTPGAMRNTNKNEFYINYYSPMSRGTRAQQASMYVIYDAPLQMFCDNPSNYRKEPLYTHFISRFPTVWDKTIALEGKIGEFVIVARQNGEKWYVGGMTDWKARTFKIPLTFLKDKKYKIEILKDGINVDKHAADFQILRKEVVTGETLSVDMAAGGGYAAILTPIQ
jgi:alpha-glucosidase